MSNIKQSLQYGRQKLNKTSSSFALDAEVLLSYILNVSKAYLYTRPEQELTAKESSNYQQLILQRAKGIPIAYLTKNQEFWSLNLKVSPATLIPRADTELLVSKALAKLQQIDSAQILELGTGSGAIAIALAKMRPDLQITACDVCKDALEVAKNNAKELAITNIKFVLSDWFSNIDKLKFDAIIANPPYVAANDPHLLEGDVRFEPKSALISGDDGLESLTYIIANSYNYLVNAGFILVEHGYDQRCAVTSLLQDHGFYDIVCWQDLQGNDRVSFGVSRKGC